MISHLLCIKARGYFRKLRSPLKAISSFVLILASCSYGVVFGMISNATANGKINVVSNEELNAYFFLVVVVFTQLRVFFPVYTPLAAQFPKYFPVFKIHRYLASLLVDFISLYFFSFLVFIVCVGIILNTGSVMFILSGLIVLLGSQVIARSFKYLISYHLRITGYGAFILIMSFVACFHFLYEFEFLSYSVLYLLPLVVCLLLFGFIQELSIIQEKKAELFDRYNTNIYIKILTKNKRIRVTLIAAFLFKLIFLSFDLFIDFKKGDHITNEYFLIVLASPLLIFTYVFNNIWGFAETLWLNLELRSGKYKDLIIKNLCLMTLPLIIDLLISMPYLLIAFDNYAFVWLYYVTAFCYLAMTSTLCSIRFPRKVNNGLQLNGSTSPVCTMISILGVFVLASMRFNNWFYLFIPVMLLTSTAACWLSIKIYKRKKYNLTMKFFSR